MPIKKNGHTGVVKEHSEGVYFNEITEKNLRQTSIYSENR
jgi:hypothetical protein